MTQPPYPQQPPPNPQQPPFPPMPAGYGAPGYGPPPGGRFGGGQNGGGSGPPPGYGPPPGGYGPGPGAPPPPPRKKSSAGKIIAIVAVVLVVLLAGAGFAVYKFVSGVSHSVGGLTAGAGSTCSSISTDDVNGVLGGQWDVVQLGGLGDIAGGVLDSRVLPDAPSCWAVQNADGKLARLARYQGGDAAARFATEKTNAKGTSTDQGNGLSVSTDGYLGKDVQAGDEAFCTTGDMLASAGALVRRGDTLFYVSTTAAGDGASSVPDIDLSGSSSGQIAFGTDQANCDLAVKLIATMH